MFRIDACFGCGSSEEAGKTESGGTRDRENRRCDRGKSIRALVMKRTYNNKKKQTRTLSNSLEIPVEHGFKQ